MSKTNKCCLCGSCAFYGDMHCTLKRELRQIEQLQAENERLKLVIVDVHDLSYPGLAIKEGTLLNKIYKLTMGYNTEQALKGDEK